MKLGELDLFVSTIHLIKAHLDWGLILCILNYDFIIATLWFVLIL